VLHGLTCRQSFRRIVAQQTIHEVNGLWDSCEVRVLGRDELLPGLLGVTTNHRFELVVNVDAVLVQPRIELIGAEDLGDLDELVLVVVAAEEGFLAEDESREHAAKGPQVETVVVVLHVHQQLGGP
jgi:hypothetical protein